MLIEKDSTLREINRAGKWHLKVINVEERLSAKHNPYMRITCITSDDRVFIFPVYLHDNGLRLLQDIARSIGYEHVTNEQDNDLIDSSRFVGGFFYAVLGEYTGKDKAYESGYYVKQVWASRRRYDKTGSPTFKRVRVSNREYSTYKS